MGSEGEIIGVLGIGVVGYLLYSKVSKDVGGVASALGFTSGSTPSTGGGVAINPMKSITDGVANAAVGAVTAPITSTMNAISGGEVAIIKTGSQNLSSMLGAIGSGASGIISAGSQATGDILTATTSGLSGLMGGAFAPLVKTDNIINQVGSHVIAAASVPSVSSSGSSSANKTGTAIKITPADVKATGAVAAIQTTVGGVKTSPVVNAIGNNSLSKALTSANKSISDAVTGGVSSAQKAVSNSLGSVIGKLKSLW